jgi:hypothetical protein
LSESVSPIDDSGQTPRAFFNPAVAVKLRRSGFAVRRGVSLKVTLLFVFDAVIDTGWDKIGEAATICGTCLLRMIWSNDKALDVLASSLAPSGRIPPQRVSSNVECGVWFFPFSGPRCRYRAAFVCSPHWKSVPSIHIRCMITASLRASATRARLAPAFLAIRAAQAFSADHRVHRVSITLAAS